MNDRELTYRERAVYGTCPVCGVGPGKRCDPNIAIPLVADRPGGVAPLAHLARIQNAPRRVLEAPIT